MDDVVLWVHPGAGARSLVGAVLIFVVAVLTAGLSGLVFPFIYNRMYIKHLIGAGYKASSSSAEICYVEQRLKLPVPREVAQSLAA